MPETGRVQIRPGKVSDAADIAKVFAGSLDRTAWWKCAFVDEGSKMDQTKIYNEVVALRTAMFRQSLCTANVFIYVAVVDGRTVGFCMSTAPAGQHDRRLTCRERVIGMWCKKRTWIIGKLPRSTYIRLFIPALGEGYLRRRGEEGRIDAKFFGSNIALEDETNGYWFLNFLCVTPEQQGRGIGARLLDAGLDHVQACGQSIYLGATPEGKVLYQRRGFDSVATMEKGGDRPAGFQWTSTIMRRLCRPVAQ